MPPGWPSGSRSPARSTTPSCRRSPWCTSAAASWPSRGPSPPARCGASPRWPVARRRRCVPWCCARRRRRRPARLPYEKSWRRSAGSAARCRSRSGRPARSRCRSATSASWPPPSGRPSTTWWSTPAPRGRRCSPTATRARWWSRCATTAAASSTTRPRSRPRGRSACSRASRAGSSSSAGRCGWTAGPVRAPRSSCGCRSPRTEMMSTEVSVSDEPVRVMVVDDHPVWRDGVRGDLEASGRAVVVAEAADGGEAIERAREVMPELVLMDLNLPTVRGVEAIRRIVEESPHVKVLVLSASGEEADVLEAVKVGASGYLLKSATAGELAEAVARVRAGEPVFSANLAGLVLGEFRRMSGAVPGSTEPGLTPRETEVLKLVAKGYTYREIADKLVISVKTVQNHVQNILTKLQLSKRYELMRYAIKRGLDRA